METGDLVLCTVKTIDGTTVFVKIEDDGEGTIVTSEIAPGRIRNLRDYVIPGKKIVCKILELTKDNANLSLRRVTAKEKKEVMEVHEKEKNSLSILKSIIKEKAEIVAEHIKKSEKSVYDFLQSCKDNPKLLEKYLSKDESEKVCKILLEKKEKHVQVKKEFILKSNFQDGLLKTKKILMPYKENISYIAAGKFVIKIKAENYKKANYEVQKILSDIENQAKKEKLDFEAKEK